MVSDSVSVLVSPSILPSWHPFILRLGTVFACPIPIADVNVGINNKYTVLCLQFHNAAQFRDFNEALISEIMDLIRF